MSSTIPYHPWRAAAALLVEDVSLLRGDSKSVLADSDADAYNTSPVPPVSLFTAEDDFGIRAVGLVISVTLVALASVGDNPVRLALVLSTNESAIYSLHGALVRSTSPNSDTTWSLCSVSGTFQLQGAYLARKFTNSLVSYPLIIVVRRRVNALPVLELQSIEHTGANLPKYHSIVHSFEVALYAFQTDFLLRPQYVNCAVTNLTR